MCVELAGRLRQDVCTIAKPHQLRDVVGAARLDAGSERRLAHAAERLTQHDRAGRGTVHIQVAGADRVDPDLLFAVVEAFESRRQSVAGLVHEADGFFQVLGLHHAQHRAEELGQMGEAARLHAPLDGRPHDVRVLVGKVRHDGPRLARFQFLERRLEHAGGRPNQRAHLGLQIPGRSDRNALDRIAQCLAEGLVVEDLFFQDQQRRGRTLLAAVAERGMQHVLDGQIAVGDRGDDRGVLAAGLGQQLQVRLVLGASARPFPCRP